MFRVLAMAAAFLSTTIACESMAAAGDRRVTPIPGDAIEIIRCELEFEMSTMVGSNTGMSGSLVVQECNVKLGDKVKAGDVLGRLNDRDLRARLALLEAMAQSDIDIRVGESRMKEATEILKRLENLRQRSKTYTSEDEYGKIRLEAETATLEAEQARHRQRIAKLECLEVRAQIKNREIVSPHDGTVVEVFKKVGEATTANEPMFQIVNTDVMKVTGFLNLEQYGQVVPGQEIQVYPEVQELNSDKKKSAVAVGKIVFVDRRVDPKTRTCKIVAQISHAGPDLPSGVEARMIILANTSAKKAEATHLSSVNPATPTAQPLTHADSSPNKIP